MDKTLLFWALVSLISIEVLAKQCPPSELRVLMYKSSDLEWFNIKAIPDTSNIKKALDGYSNNGASFRGKKNKDQVFIIEAANGQLFKPRLMTMYAKFTSKVTYTFMYGDGTQLTKEFPQRDQPWDTEAYNPTKVVIRKLTRRIEITVQSLKNVTEKRSKRKVQKIRVKGLSIRACLV